MRALVLALLLVSLLVSSYLSAAAAPPTAPPTAGSCMGKCNERCIKAGRYKRCFKYCCICCDKCKCVPSGTYGNKSECPCYRDMLNSKGKPKCP